MAAHGPEAAALALHRFGFGPVGDSISAIANDPRGALLADLDRPGAGQIAAVLPSSAEAARAGLRLPGRAAGAAKTRAARQARGRRQKRVDGQRGRK